MVERSALGIIAGAHGSLQQIVLVGLELSQRFGLVDEGFFGLLLLAMKAQQAFAGFGRGAAQRFDAGFGFGDLRGARPGTYGELLDASGQYA